MKLGYNTNGLAHHDPIEAIQVLASIGYQSVALTIDQHVLNPFHRGSRERLQELRQVLQALGMGCVIETGARFLLDPWVKHEPTLVTPEPEARQRRVDFYRYCLDVASELEADCVSIWSGVLRDQVTTEVALDRLMTGLQPVLEHAAQQHMMIGFEPEPGMFVDSISRFERLLQWVDHPQLGLTLDVGHLLCQGEVPLADYIARLADRLVNIHLEDMRAGVHEHLMFGEGEISFPPVLAAIRATGFRGGVHVELSRHSHDGAAAAQQAWQFLAPLWPAS